MSANQWPMKLLQKHDDTIQLLSGFLAATLVAWHSAAGGAPWWRWFPLACLTWIGVQGLWVVVWYLRRKFSYQRQAAANKADLQAGGDGWPGHRESEK